MSFITHIGTSVPKFKNAQRDIQKFMVDFSDASETEKRKMGLMYARSGIETRYSVVPDYSCDIDDRVFFPKNKSLSPFPGIESRMKIYEKEAVNLGVKAVIDAVKEVDTAKFTHLISVSCTGLSAPGLDVALVEALNLPTDIVRTSINFMGCYAAIHAFKQADAICKSQSDAKVLIVLVELCTLHFQKENTIDFITSNLLFGDGAACCVVENEGIGLEIRSFYSKLYLEKQDSMAWHVSSSGFLMSLKSEVPAIIEDNLASFVASSLDKSDVLEIDNWVIHPGGKSILESSAKALKLGKEALAGSYEILRNFGNMSSCTLVFILKNLQKMDKQHTFVSGFGPGITMESMILKTKQ